MSYLDDDFVTDDQVRAAYASAVDSTDLGFDREPVEPAPRRFDANGYLLAYLGTGLASVRQCRRVGA